MNIRTIAWIRNRIKIIDQTKLPRKLEYLYLADISSLWQAIKELKVRGAPALGAAAGLGVYLGIRDFKGRGFAQFEKKLDAVVAYLGSSRPTAKNLFWGLERMRRVALDNRDKPLERVKEALFNAAQQIIEEDRFSCRRIGEYGQSLIKNQDTILTVCNAGILATIDYGTALALIYRAKEKGKKIKVYACETRPILQGARLTSWELKKKGIDVTLICDNTACRLMQEGKIRKVITGADRIAANGDTANKIGTYNLAVLAEFHRIPFYVACPASTFDLSLKSGKDIPIEERDPSEVSAKFLKKPLFIKGLKVFNPAFDLTPQRLITAIITERGIIRKPYHSNIKRILGTPALMTDGKIQNSNIKT
jgi:methylthioribose-1-phosphate isomerase